MYISRGFLQTTNSQAKKGTKTKNSTIYKTHLLFTATLSPQALGKST